MGRRSPPSPLSLLRIAHYPDHHPATTHLRPAWFAVTGLGCRRRELPGGVPRGHLRRLTRGMLPGKIGHRLTPHWHRLSHPLTPARHPTQYPLLPVRQHGILNIPDRQKVAPAEPLRASLPSPNLEACRLSVPLGYRSAPRPRQGGVGLRGSPGSSDHRRPCQKCANRAPSDRRRRL